MLVMTKKKFKEHCDLTHVYGRGASKINSIYFDWKDNENGKGFKYAVATSIENGTKAELFNDFYNWVCKEITLPYWIFSKYAKDDTQRFKVPITFNNLNWN